MITLTLTLILKPSANTNTNPKPNPIYPMNPIKPPASILHVSQKGTVGKR